MKTLLTIVSGFTRLLDIFNIGLSQLFALSSSTQNTQ
jgi:hypothetical protein